MSVCTVMGWLVAIAVMFIVASRLAFIHFHRRVVRRGVADVRTVAFKTGDILMFKRDAPIIWREHGRINYDLCPDLLVLHTLEHIGHHGWPYTHAGIVVMVNGRPHIWELTRRPTYDAYEDRYVVSSPSLHDIDTIGYYDGYVHHYAYHGRRPNVDIAAMLRRVYSECIAITNEPLTSWAHGVFGRRRTCAHRYTCTDFALRVLNELDILAEMPERTTNITDVMEFIMNDPRYAKEPVALETGYSRDIKEIL